MNKGISTYEEVLLRGDILEISKSNLRDNVFIVIFADGTQANITSETYYKIVGV